MSAFQGEGDAVCRATALNWVRVVGATFTASMDEAK